MTAIAIGKPTLGAAIPKMYKTDDYKSMILDLYKRVVSLEKIAKVVPTYDSPEREVIEYEGFNIKRDLSSGLYEILDEHGYHIPDLSQGKFNNLTRAQAHIDLYISRTRFNEAENDAESSST
jgi:hypothetical protein